MNSHSSFSKPFRLILALSTFVLLAAFTTVPLASAQNAPAGTEPAAGNRPSPGAFDPYPVYLNRHSQPTMMYRVYTPERAQKPKRFDTIRALREERQARFQGSPAPTANTPEATPAQTGAPAVGSPATTPETKY